jgi:hypothetical protein
LTGLTDISAIQMATDQNRSNDLISTEPQLVQPTSQARTQLQFNQDQTIKVGKKKVDSAKKSSKPSEKDVGVLLTPKDFPLVIANSSSVPQTAKHNQASPHAA